MIKTDLAQKVSENTNLTYTEALKVVNSMLNLMKDALTEGEAVILRGFGTFEVKHRTTRIGRNPKTGAEAPIPEGKSARFKASKKLKEMMNNEVI